MSITQTVEIPASRRLTIEVPREVPVGRAVLTFTPASVQDSKERRYDADPLPSGSYNTVEEAMQAAAVKAADPNRKPISRFFGILSPGVYGDGVTYQRNLRDEWDD